MNIISSTPYESFTFPDSVASFSNFAKHGLPCCSLSNDMKYLSVGSFDKSITIFDIAPKRGCSSPSQYFMMIHKITDCHDSGVRDIAFRPHFHNQLVRDSCFVSVGNDKQIAFYSTPKYQGDHIEDDDYRKDFIVDSYFSSSYEEDEEEMCQKWRLLHRINDAHKMQISSVAFLKRDGKSFATCCVRGEIKLWDFHKRTVITKIDTDFYIQHLISSPPDHHEQEEYFFAVAACEYVKILNGNTLEDLQVFSAENNNTECDSSDTCTSTSLEKLIHITGAGVSGLSQIISACSISTTGEFLAFAVDNYILLYRSPRSSGSCVTAAASSAAASSSSLTNTSNNKFEFEKAFCIPYIPNAEDEEEKKIGKKEIFQVNSISFIPHFGNSHRFLLATNGKSHLTIILDTFTGKILNQVFRHDAWCYTSISIPDNYFVTTGGGTGNIAVWKNPISDFYFEKRKCVLLIREHSQSKIQNAFQQ